MGKEKGQGGGRRGRGGEGDERYFLMGVML